MGTEIEILRQAAQEIRSLRNANQLMAARLETFDSLMSLFKTAPQANFQGYAPDVVYALEKQIVALEEKETGEKISA